jgi:hypothetical protein
MHEISSGLKLASSFAFEVDRRRPRQYPLNDDFHSLDFTVRIVRNLDTLDKAVEVRKSAYVRHHPTYAEAIAREDKRDKQSGATIFIAESKINGAALGTLRVETNLQRPLQLEGDVALPLSLQGAHLAHVTRFAIEAGRLGTMVRYALLKALYLFCVAKEVRYALIATKPPQDRLYYRIGFRNLFEDDEMQNLSEYPNFPLKIVFIQMRTVESLLAEQSPTLHQFMFERVHSDIEIFSSVASRWQSPRLTPNLDSVASLQIPTPFNRAESPLV